MFAQYWFYFVCLQSVEEAECHRAYDSATDVYMSSFDRSTPPEEVSNLFYLLEVNYDYNSFPFWLLCLQVALREAHEQAKQKSMAAFNAIAIGVGSARKTYEGLLLKFFKKAFEVLYILIEWDWLIKVNVKKYVHMPVSIKA